MSIKDFLTPIMVEMAANVAGLPSAVFLGESIRGRKADTPDVFWIPMRGKGSGPDITMTRAEQLAFLAANPNKQIPRALHTRAVEIDAHLWAGPHSAADDFSATENLLNQLLSALHHAAYGRYAYIGEDWVLTGTDVQTRGRRCIAHLGIILPILETGAATEAVKITAISNINQMGPIPPGGSTIPNP